MEPLPRGSTPPPGRGPAPPLVDTHAHLCDPSFDPDRSLVLSRARSAGVVAFVAVAEGLEDSRRNLALAAELPGVLAAVGQHPSAGKLTDARDLDGFDSVAALIREAPDRFAAIGEIGMDFWIAQEESDREAQRALFERFVLLAQEVDLPLNVHSRSAGRPVIEILLRMGARRVQLHAFDGRASTAMPAVEAGFLFSIPPSLVRSRQKQKLVERLPMSSLLLESDSPALGPEPEARNEPANLLAAVRAIAEIKRVSEAEVRRATSANACRLYGPRLAAAMEASGHSG